VNILSEVEYPLRKPDWFSLKTEKDSENSVNLSFVYEGQLDMDEGTLEQINSHINLPITKDEIFKCVRKLKNEKASGELKTEKDSENSVNLSFSIAVKSLPRQLTIVIGR
jgi:hypothetical protein